MANYWHTGNNVVTLPGRLRHAHVHKIEAAIPLFTLGLEKSLGKFNTQMDKVIKEKFTAVQPAVEWKFTEVALNYIVNKHRTTMQELNVLHLMKYIRYYGAIDIRNSSTERSHAIQLDMVEQLELAHESGEKGPG